MAVLPALCGGTAAPMAASTARGSASRPAPPARASRSLSTRGRHAALNVPSSSAISACSLCSRTLSDAASLSLSGGGGGERAAAPLLRRCEGLRSGPPRLLKLVEAPEGPTPPPYPPVEACLPDVERGGGWGGVSSEADGVSRQSLLREYCD